MKSIDVLRRWWGRLDRDRSATFFRFLARRFIDDRCFETAGVLSFTTAFALVPLSTVVFAVLAAFPVFDAWTEALVDFVFRHFVPEAASAVADSLHKLAQSARELNWKGLVALMVSVLLVMLTIEQTFDRIWRVTQSRPTLWRLVVYWTLLTLGVLLAAASLAASAWFFALPAFVGAGVVPDRQALQWAPSLVAFLVFTAAYRLIPNRPVPLRFAIAGGLLATLLFEAAKHGFAFYLRNTNFEQLYGALAVIPIFLLWVWLSWVVVLLGASLAASLGVFRYQPRQHRLPAGAELYACLRLFASVGAVGRESRSRSRTRCRSFAHLGAGTHRRSLPATARWSVRTRHRSAWREWGLAAGAQTLHRDTRRPARASCPALAAGRWGAARCKRSHRPGRAERDPSPATTSRHRPQASFIRFLAR